MDRKETIIVDGQKVEIHNNGKSITDIILNYPLVKVHLCDTYDFSIESEGGIVHLDKKAWAAVEDYATVQGLTMD
jgi:hypothetical protein